MQVPNILLGQCLSAKVENPIVRHNQLPERQEKSLSRHGISIQLMACQTRRIRTEKRASDIRHLDLCAQAEVPSVRRTDTPRAM